MAKMAEHFKGRVHQWFTFNEPACIVKMGYGTGEHAPGLKLPLETIRSINENRYIGTTL